MIELTQERLKELLHYDHDTGVFAWRALPPNAHCVKIGDVAGSYSNGYLKIKICGVSYWGHRLAWLYMTGEWPLFEIDHRNGIHADNRRKNLREGTKSFNQQNQRNAHRNNKIGLLGVSKNENGFRARIQLDGKRRCLGSFPTPELAHDAYLEAKRELHPSCTI